MIANAIVRKHRETEWGGSIKANFDIRVQKVRIQLIVKGNRAGRMEA